MTQLEYKFLELVPTILNRMVTAIEELTSEVKDLKKEISKSKDL